MPGPVPRVVKRWYHLYPDEDVSPEHPLHWTGPEQRWNYQCAECHSTNLRKNYDPELDHYSTTWSDLDVSCEACHGPGSAHVDWASSNSGETNSEASAVGLVWTLPTVTTAYGLCPRASESRRARRPGPPAPSSARARRVIPGDS